MSGKRKINFRYIFPEDYNPVYCNGAYGGVSSHGEIVANFFLERMPLPNVLTDEVNPDGSLNGVIATDPDDLNETIIRYVSTGLILSESSAKSIHKWLGKQIQELENRKTIQIAADAGHKE